MLSSSFSVHVLLGMPTPQRWVLDFLCPGIHASLLGMAAFPSLACSWCSCSLGFLTPGEQSRGRPVCGGFGSCVCADGRNRSASHHTDLCYPRMGTFSLEKNVIPFSSRGCAMSLLCRVTPLPHVPQCLCTGNAARAKPCQSQSCFALFPTVWCIFLQ